MGNFAVIDSSVQREMAEFNEDLVRLLMLRRRFEKNENAICFEGLSRLLNMDADWIWRERVSMIFAQVARVAFLHSDVAFWDQVSAAEQVIRKVEFSIADEIIEAHAYLSETLRLRESPPLPEDCESYRDEVCGLLSMPFGNREPSNAEIVSYLWFFHRVRVTREQVKNEATKNGWKLSDSRPFPGVKLPDPDYDRWLGALDDSDSAPDGEALLKSLDAVNDEIPR